MKKIVTFLVVIQMMAWQTSVAQTTEELQKMKDEKSTELAKLKGELAELNGKVDALKGEVAGLTDQLTPYPRWNKGLSGNLGVNFSTFNDWLLRDQPNTSAVNIGFSTAGFVNGDFEKSFWRNSLGLTLGWLKFDDKDNPDDMGDFQVAADAFNLTSLFGFKLSDKIAVSALGEYRTSLLENRFNNPGYLDLGTGATWTPMKNLVVVIHPLNYNFVFSDAEFDFQSSLGAKLVADYTQQLTKGVSWKSNLSAFMSYEGSDLSNWTWVNGFSTAVKGVGVGLDIGLRNNKQEANAAELSDNPLQTYWILGLSYAISTN